MVQRATARSLREVPQTTGSRSRPQCSWHGNSLATQLSQVLTTRLGRPPPERRPTRPLQTLRGPSTEQSAAETGGRKGQRGGRALAKPGPNARVCDGRRNVHPKKRPWGHARACHGHHSPGVLPMPAPGAGIARRPDRRGGDCVPGWLWLTPTRLRSRKRAVTASPTSSVESSPRRILEISSEADGEARISEALPASRRPEAIAVAARWPGAASRQERCAGTALRGSARDEAARPLAGLRGWLAQPRCACGRRCPGVVHSLANGQRRAARLAVPRRHTTRWGPEANDARPSALPNARSRWLPEAREMRRAECSQIAQSSFSQDWPKSCPT